MTLLDDLVAYWKLDEASGVARADSHGSNNLTDYNTVGAVTGLIGNATVHNGALKYLYINDNADLSLTGEPFTILTWLKATADPSDSGVVCKGNDHKATQGYNLYLAGTLGINDHRPLFYKANDLVMATTQIDEAHWHMVTATWDDVDTMQVWVNDTMEAENTSAAGAVAESTTPFRIGARAYLHHNETYLHGNVDETGIWKRVLTDAEILDMYSDGEGRTYPFTSDPKRMRHHRRSRTMRQVSAYD